MKNYYTIIIIVIAFFAGMSLYAQQQVLEIPIVKQGGIITDTLDNGQIVVIELSSDDAEQENDEMDTLFDDDIDTGWEGDPDDQNILNAGFRFQNITLPRGAKIDSAFIIVTSHEAKTTDDIAKITIVGEANDNPATYNMESLITDRPRTSAKVIWEVDEEWGLWTTHRTPDIKSTIQEIVNRAGWQPGNSLAIMMLGEDQGPSEVENAREIESFENISDPEEGGDGKNHPERVPRLMIYFSSSVGIVSRPIVKNGDAVTDTLDNGQIITYNLSSDDAEQENDEMDTLFDDDIDAGWEGDPDDQNILSCGLRFQNMFIPRNAKIDSAFIYLTSHEAKTTDDVAELTIVGEAADNPLTYTMDALITDRPRTTAKVEWTVDEEWGLWTTHRTPDIKSIIQELVNRNGWNSGNAIAIMMLGKDQGPSEVENAREFESFENIADPEEGGDGQNHPERVPRIVVYFSTSTSVSDAVPAPEFNIYPNPSSTGMLNLSINGVGTANVEVYNAAGILVGSLVSEDNQIQMNLGNVAAGVYFVKVSRGGSSTVQNIVIR